MKFPTKETLAKILVAATLAPASTYASPPCPEGPYKLWCEHERKVDQLWRKHDQAVERMWEEHDREFERIWQEENIFPQGQNQGKLRPQKPKNDPFPDMPRNRDYMDLLLEMLREPEPNFNTKPTPNYQPQSPTYQGDLDLLMETLREPTLRPIPKEQPQLPLPKVELKRDIRPHYVKPAPLSRIEQLANKDLTKAEFDELRGLINTVDDLRNYVQLSNIKYQKTPQGKANLRYGAPLETHNNRGNLTKEIECDELALYDASMLVDNKDHQITLVGFRDRRKKEDGHAINLIKTPEDKWVYTSNTIVSQEYNSKNEALDAGYAASDLEFSLDRLQVRQRILKPGKWMYSNTASRKMRP